MNTENKPNPVAEAIGSADPRGSCMICGYDKPFAIWHGVHAGVGVCLECRETARGRLASTPTGSGMPVIPMRETCAMCHDVSPVGFHAPDQVWQEVVHPHYQNSVICLRCFIRRADEKLVAWENGIQLFPVSLHTHLQAVGICLPND